MRKLCLLSAVLVFVVMLFSPWAVCAQNPGLTEVRVNLGHPPWYLYSAYAVGTKFGYFTEEGIKLKLVSGGGTNDAIHMVAERKDHFAEAGAVATIVAKSNDLPIIVIASVFDNPYNGAIIYRKGVGIKTPKDLEGKRIAVNPKSNNRFAFKAFLDKQGVKSVNIFPCLVDNEMTLFIGKKVDAYVSMVHSEKGRLNGAGVSEKDWGYFLFRDYGVYLPGLAIYTNKNFAEQNPALVKKFLRAAMKSWQYSKKNPEAATRILVEAYPQLDYNTELERLKLLFEFSNFSRNKMGHSDPKIWIEAIKLLLEAGNISKSFKAEDLIKNVYLP